MGDLTDVNGVNLNMTSAKVEGIVKYHFGWREESRKIGEEREKEEDVKGQTRGLENLVYKALSTRRTSNISVSGPDSIGYKLIKATMKTELGKELIKEIADHWRRETIPEEWQHSKVVMITKSSKDQSETKGWPPINFINCVRKLGEKVVADRL